MPRTASVFPAGKICIYRFARTFDGLVEGSGVIKYKCRGDMTERMTTSVTFRITTKAECDDVGALIPSSGLRLQAKGTIVHRADGFAHFVGRGQIVNATPEANVVLFKGNLELSARVGSHPALGEACGPEQHVEGWFVGAGQRRFAKMTLHVILAGDGHLAAGSNAFADASKNRIIGTLIVAP